LFSHKEFYINVLINNGYPLDMIFKIINNRMFVLLRGTREDNEEGENKKRVEGSDGQVEGREREELKKEIQGMRERINILEENKDGGEIVG